MKKHIRTALSLLLLTAMLLATCAAVQPRWTGISQIFSSLNISDIGGATCYGKAVVREGYSVAIKVELKQDGTTIKTWTDTLASSSSLDSLDAGGLYYVTSGHDYVVRTTVTIWDSNGRLVEAPFKDSPVYTY